MYLRLIFPQVVPSFSLLPTSNKKHSAGGAGCSQFTTSLWSFKISVEQSIFVLEEGNSLLLPQKGITHCSGDSFDAVKTTDIFYLCLNIRMSENFCSSAGGTATAEVKPFKNATAARGLLGLQTWSSTTTAIGQAKAE